jgi:NIPSNAP protein
MNRRSWLSSFGVCAAGSLAGLSAVRESQPNKHTWVLCLESFRVRQADQMPRLHSYLGGAFLSFFGQIHRGPKMFLEAIVAPHTPQALFLAAFPGFDEMIETRLKLAAHPGIQRARADLESGEVPVVEQAHSQILITTRNSLRFNTRPTPRETSVFELRSYRAPAWRDQPPATVQAAFRRVGIQPILNGSAAAGEHLPRFTYLIPFQSLAARQEAWARLDMDQEWISLQRESIGTYGSEAKVTSASIYSLAPYSPLA